MPLISLLIVVFVIIAGNLAIVTVDRRRREAQGLRVPDSSSSSLATFLPYYFAKTRGGFGGAVLGSALLMALVVGAFVLSTAVSIAVAMVG